MTSALSDSPIKEETRKRLGLLTEAELCAALENKPATLQQWRCEGYGPKYVKLGKSIFYRFADVQEWINASVVTKEEPSAAAPAE